MRVIIDTGSKDEAHLVAEALGDRATASSVRGFGLVRTTCRTRRDLDQLFSRVEDAVDRHALRWVRVRYGDDERVFRSRASSAA
jgi:hypothetical protein